MRFIACLFLIGFPIVASCIETIKGNELIDGTFHIDLMSDVEIVDGFPALINFFSDAGFGYDAVLTPAQRKEFEQKIKYHKAEGQRCFNEANKICLLIPNASDRKIAEDLFIAALATSTTGKSWSAIVAGLTVLLVQYGCAVLAEYNRMNDLLLESKHHFELMEFYQTVLIKG